MRKYDRSPVDSTGENDGENDGVNVREDIREDNLSQTNQIRID